MQILDFFIIAGLEQLSYFFPNNSTSRQILVKFLTGGVHDSLATISLLPIRIIIWKWEHFNGIFTTHTQYNMDKCKNFVGSAALVEVADSKFILNDDAVWYGILEFNVPLDTV